MNITNPIASIESKLFNVVEHQLIPNTNDGSFENPTVRGLYKHTGGKPLGVVGANFNATQPKVLFDAYVDCIGEIRDLDINQLDYQETKEGSKIRFRLKVANYGFKNGSGRRDDLDTYITLTSGYDGLTKTSLAVESYRLICSEIESSIALEISRSGGNLWGLLNGITHFTNHGGRKKSDLVDYVYQAGGATINDRAQKAILELSK